ncbi:MAG: hypothetical protein R8G66_32380 [Cytophagales bacterium]|nr:hypothetical protein [Cytophagales bacterium]
MEEYDEEVALIAVETEGTITLNKDLYQRSSHYFTPFEISLFDNGGEIEVENEKFKATNTTLFIADETGNWEISEYYGIEGDASLKETAMVDEFWSAGIVRSI